VIWEVSLTAHAIPHWMSAGCNQQTDPRLGQRFKNPTGHLPRLPCLALVQGIDCDSGGAVGRELKQGVGGEGVTSQCGSDLFDDLPLVLIMAPDYGVERTCGRNGTLD